MQLGRLGALIGFSLQLIGGGAALIWPDAKWIGQGLVALGSATLVVSLLMWLCSRCQFRVPWQRYGTISLKDAAIKLHEELRGTDKFFEGKPGAGPDDILDRAANYILQSMTIEVKKPPSTKWEPLPQSEVEKLMVGGGGTVLTDIDSDVVRYTEPRLKQKDLNRLIRKEKFCVPSPPISQ